MDVFLQLLISATKSYIKDTNDFLMKLKGLGKLPDKNIFFSLDAMSLYTNISTEIGLNCVEEFLY